ncbi:Sec translocon accessory complex subunit YajC [Burkholderiales bacterium]|nr:Sec translocon accessory complex subunit YajC [Burkholderiales bacterium]
MSPARAPGAPAHRSRKGRAFVPELPTVLISPAYAQAAGGASQGDLLTTMLPMIAIFVVFYFLLIRPQQKKAKEHRAMIDAIEKGNEVVTSGGIVGRVAKLGDQYVTVEIAQGIEITVQRQAIAQLLPKGTMKSL